MTRALMEEAIDAGFEAVVVTADAPPGGNRERDRRNRFTLPKELGTPSLSHYDSDGQLVFARLLGDANLGYSLAGENLARAAADDASVTQRIEEALMQSPTHRKNILEKRFSRAAIGSASDATGRIAFAEIFRGE